MTMALSSKSKPVEAKKAEAEAQPAADSAESSTAQPTNASLTANATATEQPAANDSVDQQPQKLSDQQVIEMIDEVSLEQEAEKNAPKFDVVASEPGFIRKFATAKKVI